MEPSTARTILDTLDRTYPDARPSSGDSPFAILVLTILSAQTTDAAVDGVRNALFARFPTPDDLAAAAPEDVESVIRTVGLYRSKARHLVAAARMLVDEYGGTVPSSMEELLRLPGVGRKTANIVLDHAFGIGEGVAVDTHVRRLAGRIGLSDASGVEGIERDLMALFFPEDWGRINSLLVAHGRARCTARNPDCTRCEIRTCCAYYRDQNPSTAAVPT